MVQNIAITDVKARTALAKWTRFEPQLDMKSHNQLIARHKVAGTDKWNNATVDIQTNSMDSYMFTDLQPNTVYWFTLALVIDSKEYAPTPIRTARTGSDG